MNEQAEAQSNKIEDEVQAEIAELTRYYVQVELKEPVHYGNYQQSHINIDVVDPTLVDKINDELVIHCADKTVHIPYSNVVFWKFVDRRYKVAETEHPA